MDGDVKGGSSKAESGPLIAKKLENISDTDVLILFLYINTYISEILGSTNRHWTEATIQYG